jgi:hypothetical protein
MAGGSPRRPSSSCDLDAVAGLLRAWLLPRIGGEASEWLDAEIRRLRSDSGDERRLPISIGLAARKVGRRALGLEAGDIAAADCVRPGWQPHWWSTDEAARVLLVLSAFRGDEQEFADGVDRLCATADVAELVAILEGFAVLPAPARLLGRAREGARSSVQPVFEAIACRNPYPADFFDEAAWNQLVVKCVFTGAPPGAISGLSERRNPELMRMLVDLAAERRAAGRPMPRGMLAYIG